MLTFGATAACCCCHTWLQGSLNHILDGHEQRGSSGGATGFAPVCWHVGPATEYLPWSAPCWPAQAGKQQKGDSRRGSRAPSALARIALRVRFTRHGARPNDGHSDPGARAPQSLAAASCVGAVPRASSRRCSSVR